MNEHFDAMIDEATALLQWLRTDAPTHAALTAMIADLAACLRSGGRLLSCGNGGSMCDAMHFAEELSGRFRDDRAALSALALSDPGHLSCVANDYGYEQVFARGVQAHGRQGDVLLGITTSGHSPNVLAAAREAHARGMKVFGLLGKGGGPALALCDEAIVVPSASTDRIQEIHIKVIHILIEGIERELFPANYA